MSKVQISENASKLAKCNDIAGCLAEELSVQEAVGEEVDKRMKSALEELQDKHANHGPSVETSEEGPTGEAYKEKAKEQSAIRRAQREAKERVEDEAAQARKQAKAMEKLEAGDDEDDQDFDNDPELAALREKRLADMKAAKKEKEENIAQGNGTFTEITQDEFLPQVLQAKRCIVHFYHPDFHRCKIMDMHLAKLAPNHVECKIVKINADKAPFFVAKMQVFVIPSVLAFVDGMCVGRLQGFDGLTEGLPPGREDEWPTDALAERLAESGIINWEPSKVNTVGEVRKAIYSGFNQYDIDPDELEDSDEEGL